MGYFLKHKTAGQTTASGTSAQRPADPKSGTIRFNTDTSRLEYYDKGTTSWRSSTPQGTVAMIKDGNETGDGTTTVFNSFFTTAPVDANSVIVVVGNVVQEPTQAYTISGTNLTFGSAPPNTHRIYAFVGMNSTTTSVLS